MQLQSISKSKEIGIGVTCIILAVIGMITWLNMKSNAPPPKISCLHYGTGIYVWPDNIQAFADESYGVVVGTILNDKVYSMSEADNSPPIRLRVMEVMKGGTLRKGDVLQICPTWPIDFINNNHTVLVFLEGKDHDAWLPNRSNEGVIPQDKDGRFKQKWSDGSKTSATIEELKQLIK